MILFEHKLIFIKTKKVAGTSVSVFLRNFASAHDIVPCITPRDEYYCVERGLYSKNYSDNPEAESYFTDLVRMQKFNAASEFMQNEMNIIYHSHTPAKKAKSIIESKGHVWDDYFKFSIDRNPYSYMLSASSYNNKAYNRGISVELDKDRILQNAKTLLSKRTFRQNESKYTDNGEVIVDKILRYEELPENLSEVLNAVSIKTDIQLPSLKVNTVGKLTPDDVFDEKVKNKIYERFKSTFDRLGYSK